MPTATDRSPDLHRHRSRIRTPTSIAAPTKTRIAVRPRPTATDRSLDLHHHHSRIRTLTSIAAPTKTRIAVSPPPTTTDRSLDLNHHRSRIVLVLPSELAMENGIGSFPRYACCLPALSDQEKSDLGSIADSIVHTQIKKPRGRPRKNLASS
ncbi:uncharacterized protein G2W53_001125 [Senna tora]|uniref:Uncharacterized protein n=1 Tax=Senna tora TaxID=362788 RepID=A0A834XGW4_9FABA|nr:uncharacterized protein G2W53_001125 [Senna tora]